MFPNRKGIGRPEANDTKDVLIPKQQQDYLRESLPKI
jgi:hypothetical protein